MSLWNRLAAGVLLLSPVLFAQVQQPGQLPPAPGDAAQYPQATTEPLTLGEKYHLAIDRTIDPMEFVRIGFGAALDQERNYPKEWGQG